MDLEKDILDQFTDETGNVVGPTDEQLEPYTFEKQKDDLTETLGGSGAVKKFFDFMAMRVFLPWARALTKRLNSFTDRVSGIEKDVIAPAEQATANAQNAAELASAAAETAMAKGQAGSILDVVTKQPLHFGTGDDDTVAEIAPVLPGQTLIFDPNDTSWEDLLKDVADKAPKGYCDGKYPAIGTVENLDALIEEIFYDLEIGESSTIWVYLDEIGSSPRQGSYIVSIHRLSTDYGRAEARNDAWKYVKYKTPNGFGLWCEIDPPMVVGVEYRTSARLDGKAVYVKKVNLGSLKEGMSIFSGLAEAPTDVVDVKLYTVNAEGTRRYAGTTAEIVCVYAATNYETDGSLYIGIKAHSEDPDSLTAVQASAVIKYTKE